MFERFAQIRKTANVGGWLLTNATFLAMKVEVDAAVVAKMLPWGLRPSKPATARVFVAKFPESSWGSSYNEAGVFVDVRRGRGDAMHCPWIVVDDDLALIYGREVLGYPKKLGAIEWKVRGDDVEVTVERRGVRLIDVRARLGARDPSPPPMEQRPTYNVSCEIGLSVPKLLRFAATEEILEARKAEVDLRIHASETDPLHELRAGRVIEAHHYRLNLGGGGLPLPVAPVSPGYWIENWALRYR